MASVAAAPEEVVRTIRAMDEEFVRNVDAKDAEKLVTAFYASDAQVLAPNRDAVSGRAAILELWKGLMAAGLEKLSLKTTRIEASRDLAYGSGTYEMALSTQGKRIEDNGKYVVVYRRQADGQWRAVADIFNTSQPAA